MEKINAIYPESVVLLAEDLSKANVLLECPRADLLHFATHGILEPENPLFSSLLLADGRLFLHEIFDLELNADMVTLSACNTALGKLTRGDEIVGLCRGFIYAGTPSIIATLWSVLDTSTTELMVKFYEALKTGKSRSESLREAQLETAQKHPHPYYWAPFILIGDWR